MLRERRYYSYVRTLAIAHLSAALGFAFLVSLVLLLIPQMRKPGVIIGFLGAACLIASFAPLLILARRIWPTEVGPDGVRGYDSIGRYFAVRWNQMDEVKETLGYLWIRVREPRTRITVPTYLEDFGGFVQYVIDHAPVDNSLRLHLQRTRGFGGTQPPPRI